MFKFSNIRKHLGMKEYWKNVGYTVLGAISGEVLSATIQGLSGKDGQGGYRFDMSGVKGDVISGVVVGAVGLALDKPAVAIGTIATKTMKQVYIHGNPLLVDTVGSPIPPASKDGLSYFNLDNILPETANTISDNNIPNGMELIAAPDGQRLLVSAGNTGETVSDYSNIPLSDYSNEPLADYSNEPLSDYSNKVFNYEANPNNYGFGLSDNWDSFSQAVASGKFLN